MFSWLLPIVAIVDLVLPKSPTVVLGALELALSAGCAEQSATGSNCEAGAWSGSCKLHALTKVEDRDLPIPYVVYEADYTPEINPQ